MQRDPLFYSDPTSGPCTTTQNSALLPKLTRQSWNWPGVQKKISHAGMVLVFTWPKDAMAKTTALMKQTSLNAKPLSNQLATIGLPCLLLCQMINNLIYIWPSIFRKLLKSVKRKDSSDVRLCRPENGLIKRWPFKTFKTTANSTSYTLRIEVYFGSHGQCSTTLKIEANSRKQAQRLSGKWSPIQITALRLPTTVFSTMPSCLKAPPIWSAMKMLSLWNGFVIFTWSGFLLTHRVVEWSFIMKTLFVFSLNWSAIQVENFHNISWGTLQCAPPSLTERRGSSLK